MGKTATPSEPVIFVVDDDEAVCDSLSWMIGSANLVVRTFSSAQEFLQAYRPGERGCLVLDVHMPGMSGLDLYSELARRAIDLPVIFITGHGETLETALAKSAGAFGFLEKPFLDETLLELVRRAIESASPPARGT